MSENSIIQISAETSGVSRGVQQAERSLQNLAQTAQKSGSQAATSLSNVGEAAEKAAQKQERASRSIERSLQREIAMLQAGERGSRAYYESLAKQRGVDTGRLTPMLNELDSLRKKTDGLTISQGQYNAALRTMPAQMTDIVTQLAGGQSPFLIAIQQGGQMRDSFGGFGNMFKGIAASISPFKFAVGGAVGAVGALGYAMYAGAKEGREFQNALTLSGSRAGLTANQLQTLSDQVGSSTKNWATAREVIIGFAQEGTIAEKDYAKFAQAVTTYSVAAGKDVGDLVAQFSKIGEDPVKAVVELSKQYRSLTADVHAQVQALVEQGREAEAVRLVQEKMAQEMQHMGQTVQANLGYIEQGWLGVKNAIGGAWEALKAFGREQTAAEKIADLDRQIAALETQNSGSNLMGNDVREYRAKLLREEREELLKRKDSAEIQAAFEKRQFETQQKHIKIQDEINKLHDKTISQNDKLLEQNKKLAEYAKEMERAGNKTAAKKARETIAFNNKEIADNRERERKATEREKSSVYRGTPMARLNPNQKRLYELAKQSGEDPAKWLALYQIESRSGNDLINESSGATGHFQIMPQFFKDYGVSRAGAMDLATSFQAVRKHHARASAGLRKKLGRDLTAGEYYLGHQQGWGGATALLSNPDKNVVDALATIMSRGRAQAQVVQNGGRTTMTARQFASMWVGKANKLQQQFGGKGIGSLDSSSAAGLYEKWDTSAKILKKSDYEQYLEQNTNKQLRAQVERELAVKGKHRVTDHERDLRSRPGFANWTKAQQNSELAKARAADELATNEKIANMASDELAKLQQKHDLIGKTGELVRLQYETQSGSLKHLSDAQKAALIEQQKINDAAQKQYETDQKYGNLIDELAEKTLKNAASAEFELSLMGKAKSEIERLSLAREYDLHIMQATSDGASAVYIDGLQQQKIAAENARKAIAEMQAAAKGQVWGENGKPLFDASLNGAREAMGDFFKTYSNLHSQIENWTTQSFEKMGSSLADFVATGKADFREMAQSMIADLSRVMIKAAFVHTLKAGVGVMAGGDGWVGSVGNVLKGAFGFSDGGYTGHGGKFEPAGIVHKGEYVLSQENLRSLGGVAGVENLLFRAKGYSNGGLVGGGLGVMRHVQAAAPQINITVNVSGSDREEAKQGAYDGVSAALQEAMVQIADMRIAENLRVGGAIANFVRY